MNVIATHRKACTGAALTSAVIAAVLGLVVGFVPEQGGYSMRRKLDTRVMDVPSQAVPVPIVAENGFAWQWRGATAAGADKGHDDVMELDDSRKGQGIVRFMDGGIGIATVDGLRPVATADTADGAPVLGFDGGRMGPLLIGTVPEQYGEPLDGAGKPLRWLVSNEEYRSRLERECRQPRSRSLGGVMRVARRSLPEAGAETFTRAGTYRAQVERFARKYGVSPRLVYAIMHAESGFDPDVVSHASARGLMQVVPGTAGEEVSAFLARRGESQLSVDLLDPESNIKYGTAYLYLLLNRHLADIRHPYSRELCAIAAYNGGPNRVLRVFDADRDKAVESINAMTPQQVYDRLVRRLPGAESRGYVDKVLASLESFSDFR